MTYDLTSEYDPDEVPAEWYEARMRKIRDQLLLESDWTQLDDVPVDRNAWATWRQQLRKFPDTWTPEPAVTFPDPPDA